MKDQNILDEKIQPFDDSLLQKIEDLPNGDSVYEFGEPETSEEQEEEENFYHNLAEDMDEASLKKLASYLANVTDEDITSRKDWIDSVEEVKKYLGFSLEDLKDMPFKQATRTFDTTFSTALIRFYASTRTELLPPTGPAGFKLKGSNEQELELKGENIKDWINYYLTVVDQPYYADMERFLLYLGLYGSVFRKVYFDPILNRPISRFILPKDFVVNNDCASILESSRLTHIQHLTKRDIILNIKNGIYREDVELDYLKNTNISNSSESDKSAADDINLNIYTEHSTFPIYETHAYLNLEDYNDKSSNDDELTVPLPYIVTWCKDSMEILSIRRNWEPEDELRNRTNYFIQYNYLPGFGIYGLGLAHLIGTNAVSLTKILRMLLDAGAFKNLPGGLRVKGMQNQQNDLMVGPGEFIEVDTGGLSLKDSIMPLPYSEPSQSLMNLMEIIATKTSQLASTSETVLAESNPNQPVGTTLALLETSNRIQSAVLRGIHSSLSFELQLLYKMFKETITAEEFSINGRNSFVTAEDFTDDLMITPVSDPSVESTTQRIMRAESVLKIASGAPQLHNMEEVYRKVYEALGVQDIDAILNPPPTEEGPPPIDPNQLLMADIDQRTQETETKERIANLKAEVDIFRAQLEFEKNKLKLETETQLAELKAEIELLKSQQTGEVL